MKLNNIKRKLALILSAILIIASIPLYNVLAEGTDKAVPVSVSLTMTDPDGTILKGATVKFISSNGSITGTNSATSSDEGKCTIRCEANI